MTYKLSRIFFITFPILNSFWFVFLQNFYLFQWQKLLTNFIGYLSTQYMYFIQHQQASYWLFHMYNCICKQYRLIYQYTHWSYICRFCSLKFQCFRTTNFPSFCVECISITLYMIWLIYLPFSPHIFFALELDSSKTFLKSISNCSTFFTFQRNNPCISTINIT